MIINRNNLFCDTDAKEVRIYSYSTLVAVIENGRISKKWSGYSATTLRHINTILQEMEIPKITKKIWGELPCD